MKKIIREIDTKKGCLQITISDERHYLKPRLNPETQVPEYIPYPSVTWIVDYWPNKQLEQWRAEKGIDEAEAIKKAAGEKGTAVHAAIERILNGEEFRIDSKVIDRARSTDTEAYERELTWEELLGVQSFLDWQKEYKPETIATEITVFSDIHGYAGTVDYVCRIEGEPYVIDFKTSKAVHRGHQMQVSAYRMALENGENPIERDGKMVDLSGLKTAILQVGYQGNKDGYKFTEIGDSFPQFKIAQSIWKEEHTSKKTGEMLTPGYTKLEFPVVMSKGKEAGEFMGIPVVVDPNMPPGTARLVGTRGEAELRGLPEAGLREMLEVYEPIVGPMGEEPLPLESKRRKAK